MAEIVLRPADFDIVEYVLNGSRIRCRLCQQLFVPSDTDYLAPRLAAPKNTLAPVCYQCAVQHLSEP